jgi:hypothetical protein
VIAVKRSELTDNITSGWEGQDGSGVFEESQTCPADRGSCPAIRSLPPPRGLACCNAPAQVHNVYQTFDCGGTEWWLAWSFQGDEVGNYITAAGQCYGFWDCACIYEAGTEPATYKAEEHFEPIGFSGGRWVVWYNVTAFTTPQSSPCTSGTCQKTGHRENIQYTFDAFEPYNSVTTQQVYEVFDCPPSN